MFLVLMPRLGPRCRLGLDEFSKDLERQKVWLRALLRICVLKGLCTVVGTTLLLSAFPSKSQLAWLLQDPDVASGLLCSKILV